MIVSTLRSLVCLGLVLGGVLLSGCDRVPASRPIVPVQPAGWTDDELRGRLDAVLEATRQRHMEATTHAAWQVMHGALVYGRDLIIKDPDGNLVSAIDYLFAGGEMQGWNLRPAERGVHCLLESGSKTGQGHRHQWIGYLALSPAELAPDTLVRVAGRDYQFSDLLSQAQWECREGMEASWTVMALSAYLPIDAEWQASDGETWTIERLVAMEAAQNIAESACGGTHRLTAITAALNRYLAEGRPIEGGWADAQAVIERHVQMAREYQQPNGAFSTSYFVRPANNIDAQTLIGTTGHTLEFLAYALSDEELRQPWVRRSVEFLVEMFEKTEQIDLECGALYHAAAGLAVYRSRVFGPVSFPLAGK
jgi:hypothetical protein